MKAYHKYRWSERDGSRTKSLAMAQILIDWTLAGSVEKLAEKDRCGVSTARKAIRKALAVKPGTVIQYDRMSQQRRIGMAYERIKTLISPYPDLYFNGFTSGIRERSAPEGELPFEKAAEVKPTVMPVEDKGTPEKVNTDPATYADVIDAIEEKMSALRDQSYSASFAAINSRSIKRLVKECVNDVLDERAGATIKAREDNMGKVIKGFGEVIDAIHRQDGRIADHVRSVMREFETSPQPSGFPDEEVPWWKRMVS